MLKHYSGVIMTIGERIKELRGTIPQDEFSKRIEVHKNTVGRWERGERSPDSADLNKILTTFPDINPTWLLTGEGEIRRGKGAVVGEALDEDLLEAVLEAVEEYLDHVEGSLKPAKKAKLVAVLYDMFFAEEDKTVDKATVLRLVKLAK